jgi:hypothetical protein
MATISDVSIINWNTAEAKPVASGFERTICSQGLCGSTTLTVYQRTVLEGHHFDVRQPSTLCMPRTGHCACRGQAADHSANIGSRPCHKLRL